MVIKMQRKKTKRKKYGKREDMPINRFITTPSTKPSQEDLNFEKILEEEEEVKAAAAIKKLN